MTLIAVINEFEHTNILRRIREMIAIAKREDIYKGRKPISVPENRDEITKTCHSRKITVPEAI